MAGGKDRIILGSGDTYLLEYDGALPEISEIEKEENRLGHTSSGASLEYTPEFYTAEDDFGRVKKTTITKEEAKLKLGICTMNGETLEKLVATARVTESGGKRIVKIGGAENDNQKSYAILFAHKDKKDGNIYILIVGKNTAALSLSFAKDKETVTNPEFTAEPQDDEGTLIQYIEETTAAQATSLQSASAETKSTKSAKVAVSD